MFYGVVQLLRAFRQMSERIFDYIMDQWERFQASFALILPLSLGSVAHKIPDIACTSSHRHKSPAISIFCRGVHNMSPHAARRETMRNSSTQRPVYAS